MLIWGDTLTLLFVCLVFSFSLSFSFLFFSSSPPLSIDGYTLSLKNFCQYHFHYARLKLFLKIIPILFVVITIPDRCAVFYLHCL